MPIVQTAIVDHIPERFRGQSWPPPTSSTLRPTCAAEDIPGLAAEGVTGPVHIVSIRSETPRRGTDGQPLLYRVEFCCVGGDAR